MKYNNFRKKKKKSYQIWSYSEGEKPSVTLKSKLKRER